MFVYFLSQKKPKNNKQTALIKHDKKKLQINGIFPKKYINW